MIQTNDKIVIGQRLLTQGPDVIYCYLRGPSGESLNVKIPLWVKILGVFGADTDLSSGGVFGALLCQGLGDGLDFDVLDSKDGDLNTG